MLLLVTPTTAAKCWGTRLSYAPWDTTCQAIMNDSHFFTIPSRTCKSMRIPFIYRMDLADSVGLPCIDLNGLRRCQVFRCTSWCWKVLPGLLLRCLRGRKSIRDSATVRTDTVSHCCMTKAYCPLTMAFLRQQRYQEEVCSVG